MKKIINKGLKFGAFLIKKLKDFYKSYDDIDRELNNFRADYRISTIIGSGSFYSML